MKSTAGLPDWPRGMGAELAAAYMGVGKTMFLERVKAGLWPQPTGIGKRRVWDRLALDRVFDGQSGAEAPLLPAKRWLDKLNDGDPRERP